jgi:hypothetical protein
MLAVIEIESDDIAAAGGVQYINERPQLGD